jgi:hypothetical protein
LLLSFTGGDTGIAISKKAGMVPLQMELGGKDSCIVPEDADLDLVAANIVKGGFSYRYYIMIWTVWNFIEQKHIYRVVSWTLGFSKSCSTNSLKSASND